MQLAGIDPYAHAPNDPALAFLRDEDFSRINFPHLRTIYPPLTELAFRAGVSISPTLTWQKIIFLLAELITLACLLFVLARRRLTLLWAVAYAWHPLVILEIAGSGHNDAFGVAMVWLGIAGWEARRWLGAAGGWAGAVLSKFAAVVLVPWWWYRRTDRRGLAAMLALAAVPLALCFSCVTALVESLSAMTTRFESNASLYLGFTWLARSPEVARVLSLVAGVSWMMWWARREADPARYTLAVFGGAALLSPVLHPWYLVWLIPAFCFWRPAALVALTGTSVLAYTVWPGRLTTGAWAMPVWAHVVEYVPVFLLGWWGMVRWWSRSSFRLATKPLASAES